MRTIKFRVWSKYGMEHINDLYWFEEQSVHEMDDSYYKFMQYTGLNDKNGKEIYEGDVFYHKPDHRKDGTVICVVSFSQGAFGCKGEGISQYLCYVNDKVEVIGNIYETPELVPSAAGV